jgi:GTP cyclohydrolase II
MNTTLSPRPPVAREVSRAIADLRRGVAVVIHAAAADGPPVHSPMLALPAETATPATIAEFRAAAAGDPVMALSASRAAPLLAGAQGEDPVLLRMPPGQIDIASLRALADPLCLPPPLHALASDGFAQGQALSALRLAKLARLLPAMLLAPRRTDMPGFSASHPAGGPAAWGHSGGDLLHVAASAIMAYAADNDLSLLRAAEARVPLESAEDARIVAFRPQDGGVEHLAVLIGRPEWAAGRGEAPWVRVHSECLTGDILGSRRCDCGPQLHQAIRRMAAEGAGVLLYMAQEGRGIGLVNKLRAYRLQDGGLDTLDANRALGFGADERSFAAAATMLRALGINRIRLLTNNPDKLASLAEHGIEIAGRVSHAIAANGVNDLYLETKARRFGHILG